LRISHTHVFVAATALLALSGCGGSGGDCPALSLDMQSLAAQAARVDLEVFDSGAVCDGNDVGADAPSPVVTRSLDGHAGTTLQLPAGHYVVVMHAFDASGAFIGSACEAEVFTPGQHACVSVALSTPMIDGDGGIPDLALGGGGNGGGGGGGSGGGGGDMGPGVFTTQSSGVTTDLYEAWSAGGGVVYVVGAAGVLLKTSDAGATWTKQTTNTTHDLEGVWGASANDVWAVGLKGTVLHTTDGTTWNAVSVTTADVGDVWGASGTDVYVVGSGGLIKHYNGSSWSSVNASTGPTNLYCVWGASGADVYIFGANGLGLSGSAANGFNKLASPTSDGMYYGWGSAGAGDIWVPSNNSTFTSAHLWHSSDRGQSWQSQLMAPALGAVWVSASGHAYVVGYQIWDTIDGGATWNTAGGSPAPLYGIGGDTNGTAVWAVGQAGTILHRP
jgi:photosystem II stability/assembly factor-like uncharacterized protein